MVEACRTEFERQTLLILLDTGMHISVLCDPAKHRLEIKEGHIQWIRPKTGRQVRIKVRKRIAPFIEAYFKQERPTDRRYYHELIRSIGRRVGMSISPMTCRHTFGVRCFEMGLTINEVQRLMGVRNVSVLMRYAEITDKMLEAKLEQVGW